MERIDFHGSFFSVPNKPPEKKKSSLRETEKSKKTFSQLLDTRAEEEEKTEFVSAVDAPGETELTEALDAVHVLGDKLKKNQTLETVAEYKNAVRKFLQIVVNTCYEIEKVEGRMALNKEEQVHTQIRIIDEKLERLAVKIMQSQRDEIEILRRVDEIYGLLVDLRR